ncbi:MAG: polysaccharide deacetylase family protein [Anaerolineae bacterium]|nr:polysaccharide deacetylase family protein [Anaerolineae bacterium]
MNPNPVLRKLGFADTDRLVIFHIDDVGMSQSTLSAYHDLVEFGLISSAAVMVPCPWFPQAAAYCRQNPKVDMGVHLTLTSEWDAFRWGPISTRDRAFGLMDDEGYFPRRQPSIQEKADLGAVRAELRLQIQRALDAGIDVTHIDSHMFTLGHPRLIPIYMELAFEFRLPPSILLRGDETSYRARGLDGEMLQLALKVCETLEGEGFPLLDHECGLPLDKPEERVEQAKQLLREIPAGITHFYMHPTSDTPELRAHAPDWPSRVADYHAFMSSELRDFVHNEDIHVIGNRILRDLLR